MDSKKKYVGEITFFDKTKIKGWARLEGSDEFVKLALYANDVLLTKIWANYSSKDGSSNTFTFAFSYSLTRMFPANTEIKLYFDNGEILTSKEPMLITGEQKDLSALVALLQGGYFVSKWGGLSHKIDKEKFSTILRDAYPAFHKDFKEVSGYDLFLAYGSLLGYVREGDFIPHDDDIDLAYVSACHDEASLVKEMFQIIEDLKCRGYRVEFSADSGHFHAYIKSNEGNSLALDIFLSLEMESLYNLFFAIGQGCSMSEVLPLRKVLFKDVEMYIPHNSEKILSLLYGDTWKIPDPYFNWSHLSAEADAFSNSLRLETKKVLDMSKQDLSQNYNCKDLSIAVCILFYNKSDQTIECIESFRTLGIPIYVLNNDSDATSAEAVYHFCETLENVRILNAPSNLGVSGGRNYLIEHTTERWLFFVDNDITISQCEDFLNQVSKIEQEDSGKIIDAIALPVYNRHDDQFMHHLSISVDQGGVIRLSKSDDGRSNMFAGGAAIVRREFFDRVGMYNEEMFVGFEDYEIAIRTLRQGQPINVHILKSPELVHDHRYSDVSADKKAAKQRYSEKHIAQSEKIICDKYDVTFDNDWREWAKEQINQITVKPNRIAFIIPAVVCGGAEFVVLEIIQSLCADGFEITLITEGVNDQKFLDQFEDCVHKHVKLSIYDSPEEKQSSVYEFVQENGIDFLVGSNSSVFLQTIFRLKNSFPHIKTMDIIHGGNNSWYFHKALYFDTLIDQHICISNLIYSQLSAAGVIEDKLVVIQNAVDTSVYAKSPANKKSDTSYIVHVGFFGRFSEEKRPDLFVDVARQAKDDDCMQFFMIGDGPLFEKCTQMVIDLGLKNITLHGSQTKEEVRKSMDNIDVLLLTSKREGLPLVCLEAMSMSIPVISSRVGVMESIIENDYNGFLVSKLTAERYLDYLKLYCDDREMLSQHGEHARNLMVDEFDINQFRRSYIELFNDRNIQRHGAIRSNIVHLSQFVLNESISDFEQYKIEVADIKKSLTKYKLDAKIKNERIVNSNERIFKLNESISQLRERENSLQSQNKSITSSKSYRLGNLIFRTIKNPSKIITFPYNVVRLLFQDEK